MSIRELKARADILDVAARLGIDVDTRTQKALCPFHSDSSPSLQFSRERQIATCFSSRCDAGTMDVVDLVERHKGVNTADAAKWLEGELGLTAPVTSAITPVVPSLKANESRALVLAKVWKMFRSGIYKSVKARDYVAQRCLSADALEIGYNSGSWHQGRSAELLDAAVECGLLTRRSGSYQAFGKGSLVFALKHQDGTPGGLYFRHAGQKDDPHLYLKNRSGLYPQYPDAGSKRLLLTESVVDAATLLMHPAITRQYAVLALYGTNGFTAEHAEAIKELKQLEEVILAMDGDASGRAAIEKVGRQLHDLQPDITISAVNMPDGEDVNSFAVGQGMDALELLLQDRRSLFTSENSGLTAGKTLLEVPTEQVADPPTEDKSVLDASDPGRIVYRSGAAEYTVLGGVPDDASTLKVTLAIEHPASYRKSRQRVDLFEDRQIKRAAKDAGLRLDLAVRSIEEDLHQLADILDTRRRSRRTGDARERVAVPSGARGACLDFLQAPDLSGRLNSLIGSSGVVGEEIPRLFLFMIALSYKMPEPLHALLQGTSGSGKTHLLTGVSNLMPAEDVLLLTRVTEHSLYNHDENFLRHRLLCLEDLDGLKEEALYALRELQSRGSLTSSTSVRGTDGKIRAAMRTVRGPIASLAATTHGELYEDNMSRCFLVAVDESEEQTRRVLEYQNNRAGGLIDLEAVKRTREFIQNCVRLLEPVQVVNPYAGRVVLPPEAQALRRLNDLYQRLIAQVVMLHQYQRARDARGAFIATPADLRLACELMFESVVMKIDDLPVDLRRFYEQLQRWLETRGDSGQTFGRREMREDLRISRSGQHRMLTGLVAFERLEITAGASRRANRYRLSDPDYYAASRKRVYADLRRQIDNLGSE